MQNSEVAFLQPATLDGYHRICEKVNEIQTNNETVNMDQILKELKLEYIETVLIDDELKVDKKAKERNER